MQQMQHLQRTATTPYNLERPRSLTINALDPSLLVLMIGRTTLTEIFLKRLCNRQVVFRLSSTLPVSTVCS